MEKAEKERIKIIVPLRSYPTRNRKFQRNSKKIKNIKKNHYGVISSQNRLENAEKEKIKIIVPFRSYPMRNRKFHKNNKKIKKNTITDSFQAKIGWKMMRKRENKNYRSVLFIPDA